MSAGGPIVVKVGGGALSGGALEDLPSILEGGTQVVVVHGGGPRLTRMLGALGIESTFREGLRVTDEATLEIAEMVFAGGVNKGLVRELATLGVPAAGIAGTDGPTLLVDPIQELGRVGEITSVRTDLVRTLWRGGFVPVVAPLGLGPEGAYNVNADSAAAALAVSLEADHLFLMTDVDGLLQDGEPVPSLAPDGIEDFVRSGIAAGGMAPKLRAAARAARGGVGARILNGNKKSVLAGALSGACVGTLVSEGETACKQ